MASLAVTGVVGVLWMQWPTTLSCKTTLEDPAGDAGGRNRAEKARVVNRYDPLMKIT